MNSYRQVRIVGTGKSLPKTCVTAEEVDARLGVSVGWVEKHSGVQTRYFVSDETASGMGADAARQALDAAGLTINDIDCIVCASATPEQPIPSTASLIHQKLDAGGLTIPAFDMNATCLSFVLAFDSLSVLLDAGRYERVLIVSAEVASAGLDWSHKESSSLFGDGAAAIILERSTSAENKSQIIASNMKTYSGGAALTEIRGGGTKCLAKTYSEKTKQNFVFSMDGPGVFKIAAKCLPPFIDELLVGAGLSKDQLDMVIPHQASPSSMRLIRRRLGFDSEKFYSIVETHGNTIAASIPMTLHEAIQQQAIRRGDRVMLMGTSAGFSVGALIFDY